MALTWDDHDGVRATGRDMALTWDDHDGVRATGRDMALTWDDHDGVRATGRDMALTWGDHDGVRATGRDMALTWGDHDGVRATGRDMALTWDDHDGVRATGRDMALTWDDHDGVRATGRDMALTRLYTANTNMSVDAYPSESEIYKIHTTDGLPLYTITMDEFLARYASREAYNYLHDALVWDHATGRFGALIGLIFLEYGGVDSFADLKTVDNGMDQVPKRLLTRYLLSSVRHSIHLNHQLVSIRGRRGNYKLIFRCTQTVDGYTTPTKSPERYVCARKVVLGVQKDCVEKVNFAPYRLSKEFRRQVNSVRQVQAQKIFLAYQNQWWKKGNANITHGRCDLPSKFTYDWRRGSNGYYIHLPSYSDGSASVASWRELQNQGSTIYGSMPGAQRVTTEVRKRIHTYMSRLYRIPEADIPPSVGGAMQLWDTYPYKASWHFYKPGFNMEQTRDYMLKPFPDHDVFHVSGSWWPNKLQSWSEAALRAVDLTVRRYL
ncbi:aplysianin-A-like [Haliotis cracherodii]|uniref:aplysianin-A-like n=1 Tax=Haliotis cracherodii TaxID=6455 RepID=UPI0039EBCD5C